MTNEEKNALIKEVLEVIKSQSQDVAELPAILDIGELRKLPILTNDGILKIVDLEFFKQAVVGKGSDVEISQELGESTNKVVSQKALSDIIASLRKTIKEVENILPFDDYVYNASVIVGSPAGAGEIVYDRAKKVFLTHSNGRYYSNIVNSDNYGNSTEDGIKPKEGVIFYHCTSGEMYTWKNGNMIPFVSTTAKKIKEIADAAKKKADENAEAIRNMVISGGLPIVQEAGTDTAKVMSQAAVAKIIPQYDVSSSNGGVKYTLQEAINAVPVHFRRGGITIKFIDMDADKYVSYHSATKEWSTDIVSWVKDWDNYTKRGERVQHDSSNITWQEGRYSNDGLSVIKENKYKLITNTLQLKKNLIVDTNKPLYLFFMDNSNQTLLKKEIVSKKANFDTSEYGSVRICTSGYVQENPIVVITIFDDDYDLVEKTAQDVSQLFKECGNLERYDRRLKNFLGNINIANESGLNATQKGDYFIVTENSPYSATYNIKDIEVAYLDAIYYDGKSYHKLHIDALSDIYNDTPNSIYDVCIIGGGAGGVGAGFALNDKNLKVCLIDENSMLGGGHTVGGVVNFCPSPAPHFFYDKIYKPLYDRGLITTDFGLKENDNGGKKGFHRTECQYSLASDNVMFENTGMLFFSRDALAQLYADNLDNISLKLNRRFIEVEEYGTDTENMHTCKAIKVMNLLTGGVEIIYAKVFIDNTDGVLIRSISDKAKGSSALGEDYFLGTDPKSLYNESAYDDDNTPKLTAISNMDIGYRYGDGQQDVTPIPYVNGTYPFANIECVDLGNKKYTISMPDAGAQFNLSSLIEKGKYKYYYEALKNVLSVWKKRKEGPNKAALTNKKFDSFCKMLVMRESYRMNCDVMITQDTPTHRIDSNTDISSNKIIALARWYFDIHGKQGHEGMSKQRLDNVQVETFGVPFGALCPKKMRNVMIASHSLGSSHIGQSACRITKTMLAVGYAAGFAAQQYVDKYLSDIRDVDIAKVQEDVHLKELIKYQEEKCYPYDIYRTWDAGTKKYSTEI
ncbi:FAD-dependent oxidoreductase [Bacteroides pyogenes]|uniref:FAD-dependent oxidoreductase n=1 Tax=Bacteroides pyogenes TaxID=310300 RepID=UPI003F9F83C4